jgi:Sel1 repeat
MDCVVCKSQNPEGAKYCGACGVRLDTNFGPLSEVLEASVRREVDSALHRYLKDQKISETEIAERVANRLIGWGKIVAIVFVPLAALAGILGFKTYTDLNNLAENGKKEIGANVESARNDLAKLNSESAELHKAHDELSIQFPAYWYSLGDRYKNGSGVVRDYRKAYEWFKKAADKDNSDAMYGLGDLYKIGLGVDRDYLQAHDWYKRSADKGNAWGMYNLGDLYMKKDCVANYQKARECFQSAADAGNSYGMYALGDLYEKGYDLPPDDKKALEYYQKSADAGNTDATQALARLRAK